jgi:hypothetical protein
MKKEGKTSIYKKGKQQRKIKIRKQVKIYGRRNRSGLIEKENKDSVNVEIKIADKSRCV